MNAILLSLTSFAILVSCSTNPSQRLISTDLASPSPDKESAKEIQGITFALKRGEIYLPLDEVHALLGRRLSVKQGTSPHTLVNGTPLVSLTELANAGVTVQLDKGGKKAYVQKRWRSFTVIVGSKRAEVSLAAQRIRAWQGDRLVLLSRVSSGRNGRTPSGRFRAGPYKARMHYSSLYKNAPMPWSVQVSGHVFIHGFSSVPNYPASHGCIRVPLNEGNPAKFFYEWIDKNTPIHITRK